MSSNRPFKSFSLSVPFAEFSILDDNTYPELTEIIPIVIASENTIKFIYQSEKSLLLVPKKESIHFLKDISVFD